MVRDLKGVMERENAPMGLFIILAKPTAPMKKGGCQFWRARYAVGEVRSPSDSHHLRPVRGQEAGNAAGRPRRVQEGRT